MRTGNPALNESVFRESAMFRIEDTDSTNMTINGTVAKTGILLLFVLVGATISWIQVAAHPETAYGYIAGGALVGFILALVTSFKPHLAQYTSPIYAGAEGIFLGALSCFVTQFVPNGAVLVPQAVGLTFATAAGMLALYRSGIVRATENFKMGILAATCGIMLVYLATIVMNLFGMSMPYIHSAGPIGIGFSLFVVVIAAMNLVLDFDFIETGASQGAPKYMEWYGAFGLLVTLVWLYIEILRLLIKIQSFMSDD